jgi:RNA polymerase sigma factor (sigma-70 family)
MHGHPAEEQCVPARRTIQDVLSRGERASRLKELRRATSLESFLARRVGTDNAQDIAQEAYFLFWKHADLSQIKHPAGYLFRIALNVLSKYLSAKKREPITLDSELFDRASANADSEAARAVDEGDILSSRLNMLSRLRPRDLELLMMLYGYECSHQMIAARLGLSVSSVSKTVTRALTRARHALATTRKNGKAGTTPAGAAKNAGALSDRVKHHGNKSKSHADVRCKL